MKKLLPLLFLAPLGAAAGMVGGHLASPPGDKAEEHGEAHEAPAHGAETASAEHLAEKAGAAPPPLAVTPPQPTGPAEYVKLDRQFIVPVVDGEKVAALMVISLAVEVNEGGGEAVFLREPKLRDEFLSVLFLHAQSGGFAGGFTDEAPMADLRASLGRAARDVLGDTARAVLLTNLVKKDV